MQNVICNGCSTLHTLHPDCNVNATLRTLQDADNMEDPDNDDDPDDLPLPLTLRELIKSGGPIPLVRAAGERARRDAVLEEARSWLDTLMQQRIVLDPTSSFDDTTLAGMIEDYIRSLRRILHQRSPLDERRAQTRARVRRFRQRNRSE
jgi:hypothetical protein